MQEEIANRHAGNNTCGLRGLVWKILLNVKNIDPEKYIALVKARAPDVAYQQIRKDIHIIFPSFGNALMVFRCSQDIHEQ